MFLEEMIYDKHSGRTCLREILAEYRGAVSVPLGVYP